MATFPEPLAAARAAIESGNLTSAEQICDQFVTANPHSAPGWYFLGVTQQMRRKLTESVASYEQAIRISPNLPEACNNLAVLWLAQGKAADAEALLRRALEHQPNYADAHNNLGTVLRSFGRFSDAVASYNQAISLRHDYVDARNNLGNALRAIGRMPEAMACYDSALAIDPQQPQVHLNRAFTWLQQGDFARGWPEYEWRLKCAEHAIPDLPRPTWDGSLLGGRTILLYADYGFGDTIQFIRYASLAHDRGGRVIVACRQPLARLLASHPSVEQVVAEGEPLPHFDVHAPVTSLPGIFATTLDSIPAAVPYLRPDPDLVETWCKILDPLPGLRIGIAWQGNPEFQRDNERSFPLELFEPLSQVDNISLVSLQRGFGREQIARLAGRFTLADLGDQPRDLMDSAALIQNLDLVIAPDTALAHLAGALAIPVWVALPHSCDWRWLIEREDSPWYPSLRLFRQHRFGDWNEVFERIALALKSRVTLHSGSECP